MSDPGRIGSGSLTHAELASGVPPPGFMARGTRRYPVAALAAVLLGLLAHRLGGGSAPPSCTVLVTVAGLSSAAVALAVSFGHRHRGPWSVLMVLVVGQLMVDATLSLGVPGHPTATGASAALLIHPPAALALAAMVLGLDRLRADAGELLDSVLVRWCAKVVGVVRARGGATAVGPGARLVGRAVDHCRAVRGPPGWSAGHSRSRLSRSSTFSSAASLL